MPLQGLYVTQSYIIFFNRYSKASSYHFPFIVIYQKEFILDRFIDFVIKRYILIIIITLLAVVFFGSYTRNLGFNNAIKIFFEKDDPAMQIYEDFQATFGNEEFILITFKDENIFSNEIIDIIRKTSKELGSIKNVQRVISITEHTRAVTLDNTISFNKIIPDGKLDQQTLSEIRNSILNNKDLLQRVISKDGTTTSIILELEHISDSTEQVILAKRIRETVNRIGENRIEFHFMGSPFFQEEQDRLIIKDWSTLVPLIFLINSIILLIIIRKPAYTFIGFLTLLFTAILTVGFFALSGEKVNIVTSMLPPVIIAIALADTIHFHSHFRSEYSENGGNHIEAVKGAAKGVWLPCLFTSLTTAVGFLSFVTATLRPVKMLGIFTALGVMTAFMLTITFYAAAMILVKDKKKNINKTISLKNILILSKHEDKAGWFERLSIKAGDFSITHSLFISVVFIFLLVIAFFGVSKVRFQSSLTDMIPEENVTIRSQKFIEENMGGTGGSELCIKAKSPEFDFTQSENLKMISDIQEYLKKSGHATSSFSIANYLKEVNMVFNNNNEDFYRIPDDRLTVLDYYELGDMDDLGRLLSMDKISARVSYLFESMEIEIVKDHFREFTNYLNSKLGNSHSYNFTGIGHLYWVMDKKLKESFIKSLLFAFVVIYFMMLFICKDFKLSILSMVPNMVPIFLTVGVMGWLDIPFDSLTIMVACVTLGISVDDTVHYLVWFKRNISKGMDLKTSIPETFRDVGKPIIITSIVLSIAFYSMILASYKPYQTFGMLSAITIIFALVTDLILLPALIMIVKPLRKEMEITDKTYQLIGEI